MRPDDDFADALGAYFRAQRDNRPDAERLRLHAVCGAMFQALPWRYQLLWRWRVFWTFLPFRLHVKAHEWRTLQSERRR